jgi:hypothetical protein
MSEQIHEEILDLIGNKRGELKTQVVRLTNEKNPRKGLKFDTVNHYYQELIKTYNPQDISIVGQPLDGNFVTIKLQNYASAELKHADENYYSSKPKEVRDRLQGVYYFVIVTIMITKKK